MMDRLDLIMDISNCFRARASWLLAAGFLLPLAALAAPTLEASLDRDSIGLGETATLSLTLDGGSFQEQPSFPAVAGLQYGGVSQRQEMVLDGARFSSKNVFSVEVRPSKEGEYTIPPIRARVDNQVLASKPLHLTVAKGNLPNNPPDNGGVFVRLSVPTTNLYLGQEIPLEIKCYCQDASIQQAPQLNTGDFTIANETQFSQGRQVTINGRPYNFLSLRAQLSPTRTGSLTLGPATWTMTVVTARDFFGQPAAGHQVTVQSDAVDFLVMPVPTNFAPAGFSGAVGRFSLDQFEAAPSTVAAGDPITLKIRVSGAGNFDFVRLSAEQLGWRDFKTYPPSSKFDSSDPLQIQGSKYFEQVITPVNSDVKEIPAFAFCYFDPEAADLQIAHPPGDPVDRPPFGCHAAAHRRFLRPRRRGPAASARDCQYQGTLRRSWRRSGRRSSSARIFWVADGRPARLGVRLALASSGRQTGQQPPPRPAAASGARHQCRPRRTVRPRRRQGRRSVSRRRLPSAPGTIGRTPRPARLGDHRGRLGRRSLPRTRSRRREALA